jgi:predicted DNA-binding transcriptional regulator AlpA
MELWTIDDLIAFLPWARSSVYELVRKPWFPTARALRGPGRPRRVWVASEIRDWVRRAPPWSPTGPGSPPGSPTGSIDPAPPSDAAATSGTFEDCLESRRQAHS